MHNFFSRNLPIFQHRASPRFSLFIQPSAKKGEQAPCITSSRETYQSFNTEPVPVFRSSLVCREEGEQALRLVFGFVSSLSSRHFCRDYRLKALVNLLYPQTHLPIRQFSAKHLLATEHPKKATDFVFDLTRVLHGLRNFSA